MFRTAMLMASVLALLACDDGGSATVDVGLSDAGPTGDATIGDATIGDAGPDAGRAGVTLKSSKLTWTSGPAGRGGSVLNYSGEAVRLRGRLLP